MNEWRRRTRNGSGFFRDPINSLHTSKAVHKGAFWQVLVWWESKLCWSYTSGKIFTTPLLFTKHIVCILFYTEKCVNINVQIGSTGFYLIPNCFLDKFLYFNEYQFHVSSLVPRDISNYTDSKFGCEFWPYWKGSLSKKSCLHIVENASVLRVQICENIADGIVTNQNPNGINRKSFQTLSYGVKDLFTSFLTWWRGI